ncbi:MULTISPECIES: class C sortase [Pseudobutyrivibrio]|uniref:Sortase A n=1 Tax=Pseudobutyrivibrio ruminis TaxID=46206 RepID=A0A1H7F9S7_9FIRM|nr:MULTISPECIES: class C sortase [Pseudobutyrivibrio]SEK22913.1 sortase A [Pseudobutyrivibrio ruminis]SES97530.1 sortase A [Pseudobutyrivibrio sp. C4]
MKAFLLKHYKTIATAALMIVGLSLLVYPLVANTWNNHVQATLVNNYTEAVDTAISEGSLDVDAELEKAYEYNEELLPSILPDSFAEAEANGTDETYMSLLNTNGDGIMGYIQIPSINVKLPIFHTTSEEVLQIGVGHLEGSSLPVGGENTHSVLSAHRGLPSATLFTDLDKVQIGEDFFIIIMGEYYAYEVDQIEVVEPDDTSLLQVEDGQDLCTLITCTPYGVNTQRLMVRGHRVPYTPELLADADTPLFGAVSLHTNYLLWVIVGLAIVGAFILVLYIMDKKRSKKDKAVETKSY